LLLKISAPKGLKAIFLLNLKKDGPFFNSSHLSTDILLSFQKEKILFILLQHTTDINNVTTATHINGRAITMNLLLNAIFNKYSRFRRKHNSVQKCCVDNAGSVAIVTDAKSFCVLVTSRINERAGARRILFTLYL
jgi:hypothetical protein